MYHEDEQTRKLEMLCHLQQSRIRLSIETAGNITRHQSTCTIASEHQAVRIGRENNKPSWKCHYPDYQRTAALQYFQASQRKRQPV